MEIRTVVDARALAVEAAAVMAEIVNRRPDALLLAATGQTPLDTYAELARLRQAGRVDAARLCVAQLDEYLALDDDDPRLLFGWMERALLAPLGIDAARVIRFETGDADEARAARAYDARVASVGGIELAVLGLGANGHLGFNEPPSGADAPTRSVSLSPETLASNALYWSGAAVPARALTAGMTTILSSRRILLLVSGERKADILGRLLRSDPDPDLPASFLRRHPATIVLADRAAHPA